MRHQPIQLKATAAARDQQLERAGVRLAAVLNAALRLTSGNLVAEYYAHTVLHEFVPFRSYLTTVYFDRGTGFIARAQRGTVPTLRI